MLSGSTMHYNIDGRHSEIFCGGIEIIYQLVQKMGLPVEINSRLELLKRHLSYHELDHILNIAYNILFVGICLEDIVLRWNDEAYLNVFGAKIIPDPTTTGDCLRYSDQKGVILLMDIVNDIWRRVWLWLIFAI